MQFLIIILLLLTSCKGGSNTKALEDDIISGSSIEEPKIKVESNIDYYKIELEDFEEILLDRDYSYYVDMWDSQIDSNKSQAWAVSSMVAKYYEKEAKILLEMSEEEVKKYNYWDISNIKGFLGKENLSIEEIIYLGYDDIIDALKNGYPVICPIDTTYLEYKPNLDDKKGRYYYWGGGHFILITGIINQDDEYYFRTHDPYSMKHLSPDGSLIGEDRLYKLQDIDLAIKKWWNMILVAKPDE